MSGAADHRPTAKLRARMGEMDRLLGEGLTVREAGQVMGIPDSQADYCAEQLAKQRLERALLVSGDCPLPAAPPREVRCWQDRAACRGHAGLFFAPAGEFKGDRLLRETKAKILCGACPVRAECERFVFAHPQYGWWAGMTEDERRVERRRRQRRGEVAA